MGGCVSALCERQKRENDIDNNINFSEGNQSKEPGSPRRTKKKKTVIPKNVVIDDEDDDEDLSITVHISDSTSLKQLRDNIVNKQLMN